MGDYETVIAIAGFFVISHLVLVSGGGGDVFFDLPDGTEPPALFPSPLESQIQSVDLQDDAFTSENISFVSSSELQDPAYQSDTVAVLQSGSDSGTLSYNLPGVQYVEVLATTNCGGFFGDSGLLIGSGTNTTDFDYVCGVTKANIEESNVNYVKFKFDGTDYRTPRLYSFNYSNSRQSVSSEDSLTGALGTIAGFFGSIGEFVQYPVRLWDYFEHFPIYIRLFYGTLLAWMLVDIFQMG